MSKRNAGGGSISLIIKIDKINTERHLCAAITYIMNENKTKGLSISNAGLYPEQVTETFFQTKARHLTRGSRQAYHYKFSFSKDEMITAEDALEFVKDWVEEYLGDAYDYVFSVHQDREHMHMHLVFNSVRREGGKFRYEKGDWEKIIKPLTNQIAEKYHTGHLKEKDHNLDYSADYNKEKHGITWKEQVQKDIDDCILQSKSYQDFKMKMVKIYQYQVREGVSKEYGLYLALTPPGKAKAIRTYRLDEGYMPSEIEKRIIGHKLPPREKSRRSHQKKNMDWAMSRNYSFIPYKELSDYQKAMVRQMLDAKRLYRKTGTSQQMHEQSVHALRKMTKENKQYGVTRKSRARLQFTYIELKPQKEQKTKELKQNDRTTDRNGKKNIR